MALRAVSNGTGRVREGVRGGGSSLTPPLSPLALDAKVAYLGDSNTAFALSLATGSAGHEIRSQAAWIGAAIGSSLYEAATTTTSAVPNRGSNLGFGGQIASEVAARAGDAATIAAQIVFSMSGTNDLLGSSTAQNIIDAWTSEIATLRANGQRIVKATIPKAGGTAAWSAPKETIRQTANAWLKTQAATDLKIVDTDLYITSDSDLRTNDVHFSNAGAKKLGYAIGQAVTSAGWAPTGDPSTLWTDASSYHTNLALAGTGGSHVGAASTGSVPNNMFADANTAGSGATLVCSKDVDDKPILTLGGTYTGSVRFVEMFNNQTTEYPSVGDTVEGFVDFEITTALSNVVSVDLVVEVMTTGFSTFLRLDSAGSSTQEAFPLGVGRYQMRTPSCIVPTGVPGRVVTRFRLVLADGTSLTPSGVIKFYKAALRKVS